MGTVSASSPRTAVYTPKRVIPHAALLRQACAHCGKFLAAASRRSRGRVSVPVWLIILSDQLPIIATVGRYPTVQLIGRRLLPRRVAPFLTSPTWHARPYGITLRFRRLAPASGEIAHVFLTRPPRDRTEARPVRLACIRHAASVDPEPGSNSPPVRGPARLAPDDTPSCLAEPAPNPASTAHDHRQATRSRAPRRCSRTVPRARSPGPVPRARDRRRNGCPPRSCSVFRTRAVPRVGRCPRRASHPSRVPAAKPPNRPGHHPPVRPAMPTC